MAKSLLVFLLTLTFHARADLFDFGSDSSRTKLPDLVDKLRGMDVKDDPTYEDRFNQAVKAIENAVEEEKLYCSGEVADNNGKLLPASQKQLCMRELKKNYVDATDTIFELKKKYLGLVHQRQLQKLTDIQKKLKADIEKNF